jgi:hypothetical protein
MRREQDWIVTVKWIEATPCEGMWSWTLWLVDDGKPRQPAAREGMAFTRPGVYWAVWRECRRRGLRFRPNVRGTLPQEGATVA